MAREEENPGEFDLISTVFAPLTEGDERACNLLDDAAVLPQISGRETVVTTDTMIAGVHFLETETPDIVARRLLRVNLSDLAAMAADPVAYFLNLSLPSGAGAVWAEAFASGLRTDQAAFGIRLLGGDTTRTGGPLTVSITMLGETPAGQAIRRGGARPGDDIYVSGSIGDAAMGLARLKDGAPGDDPLVKRFQLPDPRIALGRSLRGVATAMADVSDGLAADLGHISRASGLGAAVAADAVPLSEDARSVLETGGIAIADLVSGGDDYELVFTAPAGKSAAVAASARSAGVPATRIGAMETAPGAVRFLTGDGAEIPLESAGYRHF